MSHDSAVAETSAAGAPEDEIEITPEMIEAARDVLDERYFGDGVYDLSDRVLAHLFRAMEEAQPLSSRPRH